MKSESKQPKTSISVMKRVFSVIVVVALLASIFCISAVNQLVQPLNPGSYEIMTSLGEAQYNINVTSGTCYVVGGRSSSFYGNFYVINGNNSTTRNFTIGGNNKTITNIEYVNGITYNIFKIGEYAYMASDTVTCPFYNSGEQTAIQALVELYEGGQEEEVDEGIQLNISLPAGNILIADISNTGSNPYYLETTSGTTGAVVKPGMNNIQIGYTNSIPSSFSVPNSSWDYPSWSGTGNKSVFGTYNRQSTQGDFVLSNTSAMKYVIITNPMYPNDNNASANRLNSDLNINIDKVNSYVIYSLQTGYVSGNLIGTNDGSQYIDYEFDEDTGEWIGTNQDGDPASPVWGGQNDFENTPTTINDWLENIAHQISSFFSGAIGAITTLSVAVKNFSNTLMSLYTWLPSPVLSILSSAIMLAIVIGVIKVFI